MQKITITKNELTEEIEQGVVFHICKNGKEKIVDIAFVGYETTDEMEIAARDILCALMNMAERGANGRDHDNKS